MTKHYAQYVIIDDRTDVHHIYQFSPYTQHNMKYMHSEQVIFFLTTSDLVQKYINTFVLRASRTFYISYYFSATPSSNRTFSIYFHFTNKLTPIINIVASANPHVLLYSIHHTYSRLKFNKDLLKCDGNYIINTSFSHGLVILSPRKTRFQTCSSLLFSMLVVLFFPIRISLLTVVSGLRKINTVVLHNDLVYVDIIRVGINVFFRSFRTAPKVS